MKNKTDHELVKDAINHVCSNICKFRNALPEKAVEGICNECDMIRYYTEITRRLKRVRA